MALGLRQQDGVRHNGQGLLRQVPRVPDEGCLRPARVHLQYGGRQPYERSGVLVDQTAPQVRPLYPRDGGTQGLRVKVPDGVLLQAPSAAGT